MKYVAQETPLSFSAAAENSKKDDFHNRQTRLVWVRTRLSGVKTRLVGVKTRLGGVRTRIGEVRTRLVRVKQD